jgi:hypothetical protein
MFDHGVVHHLCIDFHSCYGFQGCRWRRTSFDLRGPHRSKYSALSLGQLCVAPNLCYRPFIEHHDLIDRADSGQPVRDDERRSMLTPETSHYRVPVSHSQSPHQTISLFPNTPTQCNDTNQWDDKNANSV